MRSARALVVALLLVLAGWSGALPATPDRGDSEVRADPGGDPLGWEAGYWYDDPLPVDAGDRPNRTERTAVVARAMARIERLRALEFESTVPVAVVPPGDVPRDPPNATARDEQVWEALLLVGEDRTVDRALGSVRAASVRGAYLPAGDRIVLVRDAPEAALDRRTLVHELVHALQDQRLDPASGVSTRDGRLARAALIEGDAGYVADLYERRCRASWSCLPRPADGPGAAPSGIAVAAAYPYGDGPAFVHRLRQRGGWDAVNAAYADPPAATTQVIHPRRYPDWSPTPVRIPDRSAAAWERSPGTTVGEASLFATLRANGAIVDPAAPTRPHRRANYTHPLATGWVGDRIVPYRSADGRHGYVLRTEWATTSDAAAFAAAYRDLLRTRRGAEPRGGDVLVVPAGPYADAFRVTRTGATVTVVNAPTAATLSAVHG